MTASGQLERLVNVEESSRYVAHTFDSGLGCVELVLLLAPLRRKDRTRGHWREITRFEIETNTANMEGGEKGPSCSCIRGGTSWITWASR